MLSREIRREARKRGSARRKIDFNDLIIKAPTSSFPDYTSSNKSIQKSFKSSKVPTTPSTSSTPKTKRKVIELGMDVSNIVPKSPRHSTLSTPRNIYSPGGSVSNTPDLSSFISPYNTAQRDDVLRMANPGTPKTPKVPKTPKTPAPRPRTSESPANVSLNTSTTPIHHETLKVPPITQRTPAPSKKTRSTPRKSIPKLSTPKVSKNYRTTKTPIHKTKKMRVAGTSANKKRRINKESRVEPDHVDDSGQEDHVKPDDVDDSGQEDHVDPSIIRRVLKQKARYLDSRPTLSRSSHHSTPSSASIPKSFSNTIPIKYYRLPASKTKLTTIDVIKQVLADYFTASKNLNNSDYSPVVKANLTKFQTDYRSKIDAHFMNLIDTSFSNRAILSDLVNVTKAKNNLRKRVFELRQARISAALQVSRMRSNYAKMKKVHASKKKLLNDLLAIKNLKNKINSSDSVSDSDSSSGSDSASDSGSDSTSNMQLVDMKINELSSIVSPGCGIVKKLKGVNSLLKGLEGEFNNQ
ncbi:hypothetical protein CANARDRAFT_23697 [[Candida] arabinofermentans NRRL YB-2248]|uniref:Inner kinetochore subunit AME1 domain-containing protein n=1 Tax=[Candida] arabinofermentans NRRL YB-2248 TaxID=983967 RepID=A0A1E4SYW2_9ASCO|nr:hypothetical protein CANARDRAFT_23697 [[Candida] arabinofermentans NRRL YB-2248]